ncbi:MAG: glycosyltransferase family 2 protein [Elusimicrobiaceae bacterium]|nr:glycosyltransferase family 2 protein [Elusimicrobiaceae bacterium]
MKNIEILLAAYNGEKFLRQQLDSVISQLPPDCRILARDDGSSDSTGAILKSAAAGFPEKLLVLEGSVKNAGAAANFSCLLSRSCSEYVMFCDQDDVWLPSKIKRSVDRMKELEKRHGRETPLLVCSDLEVVDGNLRQIAPSFIKYAGLAPVSEKSFERLLVENSVTGCTVMINRPLKTLAAKMPPQAVMHDWWLALTAAAFGAAGYIAEPLVRYRLHGTNTFGAYRWSLSCALDRKSNLAAAQRQAAGFLATFHDKLPPGRRRIIEAFAGLDKMRWPARAIFLARHGLLRTGFVRNMGLLFEGYRLYETVGPLIRKIKN